MTLGSKMMSRSSLLVASSVYYLFNRFQNFLFDDASCRATFLISLTELVSCTKHFLSRLQPAVQREVAKISILCHEGCLDRYAEKHRPILSSLRNSSSSSINDCCDFSLQFRPTSVVHMQESEPRSEQSRTPCGPPGLCD